MADNFNLRTFLSENKLTKNAKLLKEQEELSYPFGEFGQAVKDIFKDYNEEAISDAPDIVYEMIAELIEEYDLDPMSGEIDTDPMEARLLELYKAAQTMDTEKFGEFAYNELSDGSLFIGGDEDDYDEEDDLDENIVNEASYFDYYDSAAAKEVGRQLSKIVDIFSKGGEQEREEIDAAIAAAEQATGTQVTRSEKRALLNHAGWIRTHRMEMERESVENKKPVLESKQSSREKYLTRLVENALGIAPQAPVSEEEMVQEKPLPKYESIEKLMQEIDHGTNEAACKYKMNRMKEIAEMLEQKVGSLEEGEGADFVDAKKVKQMKRDIMTLRKQAEKLEKEYEKKFGEKKVKKETQTENKMENFNLKKFLVENKLTTNSRIVKEDLGISPSTEEFIKAAEMGEGIADFLKKLFEEYDSFYGEDLEDEGIFYETTPADRAILKAIGRVDLIGD